MGVGSFPSVGDAVAVRVVSGGWACRERAGGQDKDKCQRLELGAWSLELGGGFSWADGFSLEKGGNTAWSLAEAVRFCEKNRRGKGRIFENWLGQVPGPSVLA